MSGNDTERVFFRRFFRLAGPFWNSERKWRVRSLTFLLLLLGVAQVTLAIWTNFWSAQLFNALEQRSFGEFISLIGIFALIVASTMAVTALHLQVKRELQYDWRRWLTTRLIRQWMDAGRHFRLQFVASEHSNEDARIAEDIRIATEMAIELAQSFFYCALLLISFIGILWSLSGWIDVGMGYVSLEIPGHMVILALLYAGLGSGFAFLVGRPLVLSTDLRQSFEANFRLGLVRAREHSEAIALLRSEPDEQRHLQRLFLAIREAWRRQTANLRHLLIFSSGYSAAATVFPILIAAPRFIAGSITLGTLMQMAQAFQQVTSALSWLVDNFPRFAEWRASAERVLMLQRALEQVDASDAAPQIVIEPGVPGQLTLDDVKLSAPDGSAVLAKLSLEIKSGERVLMSGNMQVAVKLFKAIAGAWPWGSGRILLPSDAPIFFVPRDPYLPAGSLRRAISYPAAEDAFPLEDCTAILRDLELSHLIEQLEQTINWDESLSRAEQQKLGFARALLHRPAWLFLAEASDALEPAEESRLMTLLLETLPDLTLLSIARHEHLTRFHTRQVELAATEEGEMAMREKPDAPKRPAAKVEMPRELLGQEGFYGWLRARLGGD